jgi:UDP-glucose 4-epimerase
VLASRGSVIPLFHDQIRNGGPITITTPDMTRFLLSLDDAVDTVFAALQFSERGETYIPIALSANVVDIADVLIDDRPIEKTFIGIRPGEKTHEILISEEEISRTIKRGNYYVISSILPELRGNGKSEPVRTVEYSSGHDVMSKEELHTLLTERDLLFNDVPPKDGTELLR